ncbi:hypothetical protein Droror1_Dr00010344 [Drosera rotundifolia]
MPCNRCGSKNIQTDATSELFVCSSCGIIQSVDSFQDQYGGISGPVGTFVRFGTAGSGSSFSYRERKEYESSKTIEDVTSKLDFSKAHAKEVRDMVWKVTDDELGGGDWFPILVAACSYVVMRLNNRPLPISEVAAVVSSDVFELGRMVSRVVKHLQLELLEFDILGMLERTMRDFARSRGIEDRLDLMIKQGNFILQCAVKWFLSTGRRPGPLVVAIIVIVTERNGISVKMRDLALELDVVVSTAKKRYDEVLDALVEVAQKNLPWGKDVSAKNIMKNAYFVIQYMDMMSRENMEAKRNRCDEEGGGFDLGHVVSQCLTTEVESEMKDSIVESDHHYLYGRSYLNGCSTANSDVSEDPKISSQTLSKLYEKFRTESSPLKWAEEIERNHDGGRSSSISELESCHEWWSGRSELCRKLLLDQLVQKDVGLDALSPSYIRGRLVVKKRRQKIKAAKTRINHVLNSRNGTASYDKALCCLDSDSSNKGESFLLECSSGRRKRKRKADQDIDWEDFIIETLLLHSVEEKEIEKGLYNVLLDLHVFNHLGTS